METPAQPGFLLLGAIKLNLGNAGQIDGIGDRRWVRYRQREKAQMWAGHGAVPGKMGWSAIPAAAKTG